jgi:tetratricopeptide (TPR) repeat protein
MNEPSEITQIGMQGVNARNINANIDQSVNKTVIHQAAKCDRQIPSNVRQGSKNFVAREDELVGIHAKLQKDQGVIVCAVEGMGGVGKSELALQYADRYREEYEARYWLTLRETGLAQVVVTLANSYIDLPEPMQSRSLNEQAAWYWQNWLPDRGNLLVILDDVASADRIPDLAMPIDPRIKVLVTTRERSLNTDFQQVRLELLSQGKAIALFIKYVGIDKVKQENRVVAEICKTLGYLPLAIALVGEYLVKKSYLTFAKLQERLSLADESISRDRKNKFYAHRGVEAAIQLSWDDISTGSQRVAMFLGLFAPVEILWELVVAIGSKTEITEAELNEARGQLDSLHLIQPIDDECSFYKIHCLVRDFFCKKCQIYDQQDLLEVFRDELLTISSNMSDSFGNEDLRRYEIYIPHIHYLVYSHTHILYFEDIISLHICLGRFYETAAFLNIAKDEYQRCIGIFQQTNNENDSNPNLINAYCNLAEIYRLEGQYDNAEKYLVTIVDIILQNHHESILVVPFSSLGLLYKSQGDYHYAEEYLIFALTVAKEYFPNDSRLATCLNNLASLRQDQGRHEESLNLLLQALEINIKTGNLKPSLIAHNYNEIGNTYGSLEDYEKAEKYLGLALEFAYKSFAKDHPVIATIFNNLGSIWLEQKRYQESTYIFYIAIEIGRKTLANSPWLANYLNNIATALMHLGEFDTAEIYLKESVEIDKSNNFSDSNAIKHSENLKYLHYLQGNPL